MPTIIGVDVGGTNTDAVLIDLSLIDRDPVGSVLATYKTATTKNTTVGIRTAIQHLTARLSSQELEEILAINIGTTQFLNAIVERDVSKIARVAVLRLCGPYAREVPPLAAFPPDLQHIIGSHHEYLPGGLEIDGRVISQIDPKSVQEAAARIRSAGIKNIAVVGAYAPIDSLHKQEETVKDLLLSALGNGVNVTLSHRVAGIGFLERENATILNAAILPLARKTVTEFQNAIVGLNIGAPLFLTQNDGTLISASQAVSLPIRTFLSGPTNSLTGSSFLAGVGQSLKGEALVLDIGGTTSDVCAIDKSGFPRPASAFSQIAGIRTNFSLPDIRSVGLGGGSLIHPSGSESVTVGPDSVGQALTSEALVFGGSKLTATDIAVADGVADIGDPSLVRDIPKSLRSASKQEIRKLLERVVDEMKTSAKDIPVILVGGGSILCPDELDGVSRIIRPPHAQLANAIGAAISQVSGAIDTILPSDGSDILATARKQVLQRALENGAEDPILVEETILPVPYASTQSRRYILRAAGRLSRKLPESKAISIAPSSEDEIKDDRSNLNAASTTPYDPSPLEDLRTYTPRVENKRWKLSRTDLDFIAVGCGILGCGGGGDTYSSHLSVVNLLASGKDVYVIDPADMSDDGVAPSVGYMGSPSTLSERLPAGQELQNSVNAVIFSQGKTVDELAAIMSAEIGGSNGLRGIQAALWTGKPIVDADLMGRAYPNLWQVTPHNAGILLAPTAASDGKGNTVVHTQAVSNYDIEDILRAVCVQMGQAAGISLGLLSGRQIKQYASPSSLSLAWYLGRAVQLARLNKVDIVPQILLAYPGKHLLTGKIVNVVRDSPRGFTTGHVEIVPLSLGNRAAAAAAAAATEGDVAPVKVVFQNENIHAFNERTRQSLASVPDLISILDAENGQALGTQDYRYGLRVHLIALVASQQWTTPKGLENGGPKAFDLDIPYVPVAQAQDPPSAIRDFGSS